VLHTLGLEIGTSKKVYRIGDTAVFDARVTRQAAGTEVSELEGGRVLVFIQVKDVVVAAHATTDELGRAHITAKLPRHVPAGRADVVAIADMEHVDAPCHEVSESSEPLRLLGMFRTIKR